MLLQHKESESLVFLNLVFLFMTSSATSKSIACFSFHLIKYPFIALATFINVHSLLS
jgi:hypothetical protein